MAEPHRFPDTASERESNTGIPRWVWVAGIIVAIVVLAAVAIMLIGGVSGGHDRPRHGGAQAPPASAAAAQVPPASATATHATPRGGH